MDTAGREEPAWVREQWEELKAASQFWSSDDGSLIGSDSEDEKPSPVLSTVKGPVASKPSYAPAAKRGADILPSQGYREPKEGPITGDYVRRELRNMRCTFEYSQLMRERAERVHAALERTLRVGGVDTPEDPMEWLSQFETALDEVTFNCGFHAHLPPSFKARRSTLVGTSHSPL